MVSEGELKPAERNSVSPGAPPRAPGTKRASHSPKGDSIRKRIFVLCFMGMLAGFSPPAAPEENRPMIEDSDRVRAAITRYRIRILELALKLYRLDTAYYPGTGQGLAALIKKPDAGVGLARWRGPYLDATSIPPDGWGHPFEYTFESGEFEIFSLGADGKMGGAGFNADISSKDF